MPHKNAMPRAANAIALIAVLAIAVVGCASSSTSAPGSVGATQPSGPTFDSGGFHLTSSAYAGGGDIPLEYTCYGDSVSPPLEWTGAPADTKSFVLIMDDYSAQYTHWVVYNIPGSVSGSLPENDVMVKGALNQAVSYIGPCPPPPSRNNYVINFYALSTTLPPKNYGTQLEIENAMEGKVIAQTQLSARYKKL